MKQDSGIDNIFKEGIGTPDFPGKDAAWAKMEQALDAEDNRRRRPFAWMLLAAGLLGVTAWWLHQPAPPAEAPALATLPASSLQQPASVTAHSPASLSPRPAGPARVSVSSGMAEATVRTTPATPAALPHHSTTPAVQASARKGRMAVFSAAPEPETLLAYTGTAPAASAILQPDRNLFILHRLELPVMAAHRPAPRAAAVPDMAAPPAGKDKTAKKSTGRPWSVELVAGSDIFRLNKQIGYYGGLRFNRHLDKGTVLSAGINYSGNTVNEQYRLSNKPAQQTEADAQLNHITMIRVPLLFQRQLPRSRWSLMAGLIPSYIVDASVYNVPNAFTGDPTQYRRFTLQDINRFNVLFGAGIKYSPFSRLSIELSGSYGFTGLVKNSYINQSRVNDNFRNIQAGLSYRLR